MATGRCRAAEAAPEASSNSRRANTSCALRSRIISWRYSILAHSKRTSAGAGARVQAAVRGRIGITKATADIAELLAADLPMPMLRMPDAQVANLVEWAPTASSRNATLC